MDSLEEVIKAVAEGKTVIVVDDERRENEGDLVTAAQLVSPESINLMVQHGRGLICVGMTDELIRPLGLRPMPLRGPGDSHGTAFLDSVDAASGITTGISAHDRAHTIRTLVRDSVSPDDIVSPGHMFPLRAKPGGVLARAGHTEAAVDLARLAGLKPAGAICEILRDDGAMARLDDLKAFAGKHNLLMTSIEALIQYRRSKERLVEFVRSVRLPTVRGEFNLTLFRSLLTGKEHIALAMGDLAATRAPLVRVHSECLTGDVFGSLRCDCGAQLDSAMDMVAREGVGVVLYMRQEGRGIGLAPKLHAYELQDRGMDTVEANEHLGFPADLREYGEGAQILSELGLTFIRLLTNNPRKIVGLKGFGIEVVERVPIAVDATEHNRRYLSTKRSKLGHILDEQVDNATNEN